MSRRKNSVTSHSSLLRRDVTVATVTSMEIMLVKAGFHGPKLKERQRYNDSTI